MTRPFVHLHCHSHYSLLDGAGSIPRLIERAKDHGMNALALTDHGNLHGSLEFYRGCKSKGINPIIGYEAYIAHGDRRVKGGGAGKESSYHLTLLCQNQTGFRNLIKMASSASLEGFYFKPRIDKELLEEYHEGIICLSGCVSSEFSQAILRGGSGAEDSLNEAKETASWFRNLFGERYFVEIMNNGLDIQRMQLEGAVEIANELGIPLVATSDCHYVDQADADAQDVMLCINTGKFRTDTNRMKMENDQFYLRSPEDMYTHFPGLEDACERSQEIANTVDIDLELGKRHFPVYDQLNGETPDSMLRSLCETGLKERYADTPEMCKEGVLSEVVQKRLDRELAVIGKLGFPNYFLIVWDFVRHARELDIPTTARGSGVGALVCYALYLSHVCPIKYDLLFERFLDENRLEAPDIDIDFCKDRRADVIRYVKEKYGEASVAQIGTFGTLAARAAIKDVGRTLGIPLTRVNQITQMVPDELGITLEKAIEKSTELSATYQNDPEIRELLDLAKKVEGLARNIGTHAAAVVIGDRPLTEYVPLGRVSGKDDIITQWSMNDVEAAGLLKMDMLGLKNLTVLSKAVEMIEQTTGNRIDPHKFSIDDQKTFALLQRGETKGVFQLESGGIRDLLQKMKPDHFNDIIATAALYRPGPLEGGMVQTYIEVKHGREKPDYEHPVLKDILTETNGVMVYQEQVMRILNRLGNIPLAKAYTCIKAISKKNEKTIAENHDAFVAGAVKNGLKERDAENFWNMILKFAGYGFNKSHSTAYALIAFQTAYLKAHYPVEFMAALLSGDIPNRNFTRKDALVEHIEDCARMNIEVVAPCVNQSEVDFSVGDGKIFFGLSAVKGCGGNAAVALVNERNQNGPYQDLFNLCERVEASSCNRSTLETLIKAGAMDVFGLNRSQLLAILDRAIQAGAAALADKMSGQKNLFGGLEDHQELAEEAVDVPDLPEIPDREKSLAEKEVLGFYLSSHPLSEHNASLEMHCSHESSTLGNLKDRTQIILGGIISSLKYSNVKRAREPGGNTRYVMFDLEDLAGSVRCICWPTEFEKVGHLIQPDAVLIVEGNVDKRGGDEANLIVRDVTPIDQIQQRNTVGLSIRVNEKDHDDQVFLKILEVLRGYPGSQKITFTIALNDGRMVQVKSNRSGVDIQPELRERLDDLLGKGNIKPIFAKTKKRVALRR